MVIGFEANTVRYPRVMIRLEKCGIPALVEVGESGFPDDFHDSLVFFGPVVSQELHDKIINLVQEIHEAAQSGAASGR